MPARASVILLLSAAVLAVSAGSGSDAGGAAQSVQTIEVAVYAAASLKDVLSEIAPICEQQEGAIIVHNFGASNDLARQIVAANKADLFFSADEAWMDYVAGAGLVENSSRRSLLSNRLVVVVPGDSTLAIRTLADLAQPSVRRVVLANPAAVPAGRYARAWLESAGVWDKVSAKVVPAPDVRAAMATVEAGAVEAGIAYRTDAAIARKARVAFVASAQESPKISYPVAALQDRPHLDAARRIIECYAGAKARGIFEDAGFIVLPAQDAPADAPASRR